MDNKNFHREWIQQLSTRRKRTFTQNPNSRRRYWKKTGQRKPHGFPHVVLLITPIIWSLSQIWTTSPLPYKLGFGVFNDTATRSLHLAFGIFIAFLGFPARKASINDRIPIHDWIFATLAALCACYLYVFQQELTDGLASTHRKTLSSPASALFCCWKPRRVMGLPMTIVDVVFLTYVFWGHTPRTSLPTRAQAYPARPHNSG